MHDQKYYLMATEEVDSEHRDAALWAKSIAIVEGDENKARFKYINLRVEQLSLSEDAKDQIGEQSLVSLKKDDFEKNNKVSYAKRVVPDDFSLNYVPIEEFCREKSISVDVCIKMLKDAFYAGRKKDGQWYVHRSELESGETRKVTASRVDPSKKEFVSVEEFARYKEMPVQSVVNRVREGFYIGRLVDGEWVISSSEMFDQNSGQGGFKGFLKQLSDGDFGLAKTFWLYGVFCSLLASGLMSLVGVIGPGVISVFAGLMFLFYLYYYYFVLVGTWNSSDQYSGPALWAVLAKINVVLGFLQYIAAIFVLFGVLFSLG